jgi:hypothetical protein
VTPEIWPDKNGNRLVAVFMVPPAHALALSSLPTPSPGLGQGLLEGVEQLIEVEVAVAKGALEGVELALQRVEAGALGAVCQLGAGGIDGLGQGLARGFLAQGLHQRPHEVVDGGAVLLAVSLLDAEALEQALHRGGKCSSCTAGSVWAWRAVAQQLAAELDGKGGEEAGCRWRS